MKWYGVLIKLFVWVLSNFIQRYNYILVVNYFLFLLTNMTVVELAKSSSSDDSGIV